MKHTLTLTGVFFFISLYFQSFSFAGGFTELPRQFDVFKLGMTVEAFSKITRTKPEACPICIDKETFATLSSDVLDRLGVEEDTGSGVDFFFYKNKLYHIAAGTSDRDLFSASEEYENMFGGPGKKTLRKNGSALLMWEDNSTIITLNYRIENNEVFSVNYVDWNMKEERDWRASLSFENSN